MRLFIAASAVLSSILGLQRLAEAQSTTATAATTCPTVLQSSNGRPVVGGGYVAQLIATGLDTPRSLLLDSNGALLVVQSGTGIQHITFDDQGGTCLVVRESRTLISDSDLNHGIALSADGRTLYASSVSDVFSWAYNPADGTVSDDRQTIVTNMSNSGHSTRTLLMSRSSPENTAMLFVSRGSDGNLDMETTAISSGRSQIKAFDVLATNNLPYDYTSGGTLVGWGLRNSVGLAEEPNTGALYSVENSADQLARNGVDIHEDAPGEELNYHGVLNNTSNDRIGANYGYPSCFAVYDANDDDDDDGDDDDIPDGGNLRVGDQFVLNPNATLNDTTCAQEFVAPRLTFKAHMAPLDIVFNANGSAAFVSFHGSWNRDDPSGYKVSRIEFANGEPVAAADSKKSLRDILSNADLDRCPGSCFRPVGLAIDGQGRIFMSSDSTGEIYVLREAEMATLDGGGGTASATATSTSTSTSTPNIAARSSRSRPTDGNLWLVGMALALSMIGGAMLLVA